MRAGTLGQLATCLVIVLWLALGALPYLVDQVRVWWLRRQLARGQRATPLLDVARMLDPDWSPEALPRMQDAAATGDSERPRLD